MRHATNIPETTMNTHTSLLPWAGPARLTSLLLTLLALGLALWVGSVRAGFNDKGGMAGEGFQPGDVVLVGPLTVEAEAFVQAVKAHFKIPDAQVRQRAIDIYTGLCKAIDLVTQQNKAVGDCLAMLKKKGKICVAFDANQQVSGACKADQKDTCSENDPVNVNADFIALGCPPPYDSKLWELAIVLLHEGLHAVQDFSKDTADADACKMAGKEHKRVACMEVDAHMTGVTWADDVINALIDLLLHRPLHAGASAATKAIYDGINLLPEPARTAAIGALLAKAGEVKKSDQWAKDCYQKVKDAYDDFINADISTPAKKQAALQALKLALNGEKWKVVTDPVTPKRLLSNAHSGNIEEVFGDVRDQTLATGLNSVKDMLLSADHHVLLVSGVQLSNTLSLLAYVDANSNGVFESSELLPIISNDPRLGDNLSLFRATNGTIYIYDSLQENIWSLADLDRNGIPEQLERVVFHSETPLYDALTWAVSKDGRRLTSYNHIDSTMPALLDNSPRTVATDEDGDGLFESMTTTTQLAITGLAPAWVGEAFIGQTALVVVGELNHPIIALLVNANNQPIGTLGQTFHTQYDGTVLPVSMPLQPQHRIMLIDQFTQHASPVFSPENPLAYAPRITQFTRTPSSRNLAWSAHEGFQYQVQFKDRLNNQPWNTLPGNYVATNDTVSAVDSLPASGQSRYYRIELVIPFLIPPGQ